MNKRFWVIHNHIIVIGNKYFDYELAKCDLNNFLNKWKEKYSDELRLEISEFNSDQELDSFMQKQIQIRKNTIIELLDEIHVLATTKFYEIYGNYGE